MLLCGIKSAKCVIMQGHAREASYRGQQTLMAFVMSSATVLNDRQVNKRTSFFFQRCSMERKLLQDVHTES